jgi:hypothetical protein
MWEPTAAPFRRRAYRPRRAGSAGRSAGFSGSAHGQHCWRSWPDAPRCVGRRAAVFIAVACLLVAPPSVHADIGVRASVDPQRAQVGESMVLSIEITGAQNVSAPALSAPDGFEVQYVGPSTQISIVNGQMNALVQHRYSLSPQRPGHFTLGPFTVEYQGKQYQTSPIGVDVMAAGQPAPAGAAPGRAGQGQGTDVSRSLRLTLSVPKQEAYLHEPLPIEITLYVGAVRVADVNYPTLPGDGLSLDKFPEPAQRQQVVDGETFQVLHFHTTMIPMRAGRLTLGPASLRLNVLSRRRGGGTDPFFSRFFEDDPFSTERRPLDLHSDPITLNVLPLPEDGKPPGFSGAIGTFSMQAQASPTEVNAGDPVTMRVSLSGSGNLGEATPPALINAEGFRTYESRAAKSEVNGTTINKVFEQVLIPNDAAVDAIPPVRFSFFDPQARRYETLQSQPIALVVRAPQNAPRTDVVGAAPPARAVPEEQLGRDIVYIKDDPGALQSRGERWTRSFVFVAWQPLPLGLVVGAIWYDRRRRRLTGDVRYARFSRAGKQARRGLAAAEQALANGGRDTFYDVLSRTMQDYLGAKLDLPPGAITGETVSARAVPEDCVQRIREFFATCEQVRFAPAAADGDMRGTLALAQEIVRQLERQRRIASNSRAAFQRAPGQVREETR